MKKLFVFILILGIFSCGRIYNSSSKDESIYSPRSTGSPQFEAAQAVIIAKCSECHGEWNAYGEADYVQNGLANAQDPTNSKVYYRNQLGPGPNNDMPTQGRPAMTTDELQIISDWINTISP